MQIYISRNDEQFGPYSREEVTSYLEDGSLTSHDLAWHEEQADWKPLGELVAVPAATNKIIRIEEMPPAPVKDVPSASSRQGSARFRFAKTAIVILLIGAAGSYYFAYGPGKVIGHQWSEKVISAFNRLVSSQEPALISQKEPLRRLTPANCSVTLAPVLITFLRNGIRDFAPLFPGAQRRLTA